MKARGVVVIVAAVVLLLSAMYPVRQYVSKKAYVRHLVAQEAALSARMSQLQTDQSRLLSDAEVERIAREDLGMVRPGEVAFALVPKPGAQLRAISQDPIVQTKARAGPAWYARWWDGFLEALPGNR